MTTPDTITPDEYAMLRFPGDVPGLLRRGSPVLNAADRGLPDDPTDTYPPGALSGLCCAMMTDRAVIAWDCCDQWERVDYASLSIDITDATGRAHLAWWLSVRMYEADGPYITACVLPGRAVGPLRFGLSTISADEGARWRSHDAFNVTDHLDPHDPRLLPDRSRLVDALALSLVARHVAGLEVS